MKLEAQNKGVAYQVVEGSAGDFEGDELVNAQEVANTAEIKWY
jgi:hypothetical protein